MPRVVAINGSPRKDGNTAAMLQSVVKKLEQGGMESRMIQLGGEPVHGCRACGSCRKNQLKKCVIDNDMINECLEEMLRSDVILIGSPTYFSTCTTEVKALIDRTGYVARGGGSLFSRKIGAALAVARRAGTMNVYQTINNFFLINDMIVPGSSYWNVSLSRDPGDYAEDAEANGVMEHLAENILWLNEKIRG